MELGLSTRFNQHAFIASHPRSFRLVNAVSCLFSHFPSSPRISTCLSAALGVALAPRISSQSITARTHQRNRQMQQIARRTGTFDTSRELFFYSVFARLTHATVQPKCRSGPPALAFESSKSATGCQCQVHQFICSSYKQSATCTCISVKLVSALTHCRTLALCFSPLKHSSHRAALSNVAANPAAGVEDRIISVRHAPANFTLHMRRNSSRRPASRAN